MTSPGSAGTRRKNNVQEIVPTTVTEGTRRSEKRHLWYKEEGRNPSRKRVPVKDFNLSTQTVLFPS